MSRMFIAITTTTTKNAYKYRKHKKKTNLTKIQTYKEER